MVAAARLPPRRTSPVTTRVVVKLLELVLLPLVLLAVEVVREREATVDRSTGCRMIHRYFEKTPSFRRMLAPPT
uniref:Putative secreted protein n=1 Tax=Anopheles triannulatus TaxID=58253 RepID=A0A2M4B5T0_9DIPT